MGIKTLQGNFNRVTNLQKNPQIEGEKIENQQDYEGKNPKKSVYKNSKVTQILSF
jgi:hypothetical protein